MNAQPRFFAPLARLLHWLMALMVIAMLFIGAGLAASVSERHEWLIHLHKPLGIAILALVIVRLVVRFSTRQPPLPADLPLWQVLAAKASHLVLYALMLVLPLLGWAMISAAGDPVMLSSSVQLPALVGGECAAVRGAAQGTRVSRLPVVPDGALTPGGGAVPWVGPTRWRAAKHDRLQTLTL